MNKVTFTTLILCLSASVSLAQAPQYTGGMKYTTLSAAEPNDDDKKPIYNRIPAEEESSSENNEAKEEAEKKTPEQSAWEKYKELAAGKGKTSDTKEGTALPKAPNKPIPPEKTAQQEEATSPSGFAAIIDNYQRNKQKRSQMRSISYATPEDLEIQKPEVETPDVKKPAIDGTKAD